MTTDLEKQFFDTFGIPQLCCKEYITNCTRYGECEECENYDNNFSTYPQITDSILLQLLCYANASPYFMRPISYSEIDKVKQDVLIGLIIIMNLGIHEKRKEKVKQDIQKIFKEE